MRRRLAFLALFAVCTFALPAQPGEEETEDLEEKLLEEDDFPDLVPSTEKGEFMDVLPDEEEADFPDLVHADETGGIMDELAFLEETSMVELPARHLQHIGMSPSAVWVLTKDDIQASGATNIPDLLRQVPGMEIIQVSPFFTGVVTRLFWTYENHHILVLIDGREANYELLGQPFWAVMPLFLEDIERIEIIRGPGSSLYGANAVAGVISITTRRISERTSAMAFLSTGEVDSLLVGTRAATKIGDLGLSITAGFDRTGMMYDPSLLGRKALKLRARAEYPVSQKGRLMLDAGFSTGAGPLTTTSGVLDSTFDIGSLQLSYADENIKSHLYWIPFSLTGVFEAPLKYGGIELAVFPPIELTAHSFSGDLQWSVPTLWEPLLLIAGLNGRATFVNAPRLLDADTYSDPNHPDYHEPGLEYFEGRLGVYAHAEYTPAEWITITAGARFDTNTISGPIVSPRLATVLQPAPGQFFRLGVARAFRMPSNYETIMHIEAEFPDNSPIQGEGQQLAFQEFMTRTFGNKNLDNEKLLAIEAGYRGQFLDERLMVSLEFYYNLYTDESTLVSNMVMDNVGLPDLAESSFTFGNEGLDEFIIGSELAVRYTPNRNLSLLAAWIHREVFYYHTGESHDESPKNLVTLGGRYRSPGGLVFSLFVMSRSENKDRYVTNPDGFMEEFLVKALPNVLLAVGRLGWSFDLGPATVETGLKLFLPVSPFQGPLFRFYDRGGGETPFGKHYCGDQLRRMVNAYLQGSF